MTAPALISARDFLIELADDAYAYRTRHASEDAAAWISHPAGQCDACIGDEYRAGQYARLMDAAENAPDEAAALMAFVMAIVTEVTRP